MESQPIVPETPVRPVANEFGGVAYDDPYQWLEESTPETLAWQAAQSEAAKADLRGWAGFESTLATLAVMGRGAAVHLPVQAGDRWFQQARVEGLDQPVLQVCDDVHGTAARVLVDPNEFPDEGSVALDWWVPSPDGSFVACNITRSGNEQGSLRIVDAASGTVLDDRVPQVLIHGSLCSWTPDERSILYPAVAAVDGRYLVRIFSHTIGSPAPTAPEPVPEVPHPYLAPQLSDDGRWMAAITDQFAPRPWYVRDLAADGPWLPFLRDVEAGFGGQFHGDNYIALTTDGAPRGRIVSIPMATASDRATWRELVAESAANLRGLQVDGDRLLVSALVDVETRLRIHAIDGSWIEDVPRPDGGTATARFHDGAVTLLHQSFTRSPSVHLYVLDSGTLVDVTEPVVQLDHVVSLRHAVSADGTSVSYHLIHRAGADLSVPSPTLIYAYGGWNSSLTPTLIPSMALFVRQGGVLVQAHLRGGGEYGRDWWDGGRLRNKHRTFEDLEAVADTLVGEGIAKADGLGFIGASNGGMLAGAIANRRPELFRAVVSSVPILDLLRLATTPMSQAIALSDYGDPHDPSMAPIIASYSPYHNVREGTPYPAMLVACGESDPRCPVWHGRKMVARLQAATTSGRPVLFRTWPATGHWGAGRVVMEQSAEWLSFLMRELGMTACVAYSAGREGAVGDESPQR